MLITRTPFRVSFFGGGTDFKDYYEKHGGSVLSAAIDKYCYVTIRHMPPFFEYRNQFTYSKIERFNSPDEVRHPLVRAALKYIHVPNVQIAYDADLPACSGIGSSSSFAVGLAQALRAMRGEFPGKEELARDAVHLERDLCAEAGGVQDQYAAALGGFNRLYFSAEGVSARRIDLSGEALDEFRSRLLLVFTRFTHLSGEVAKEQQGNIPDKTAELDEMKRLTDEAEDLLTSHRFDDFGRLLDTTWRIKRTLSSKITNPAIDEIYADALSAGALGGKLLGAGGGGFMLLYAPEGGAEAIRRRLNGLMFIPFGFDGDGTKIIYEGSE